MRVAKKSGAKEEFDEGKLWNSIYYPARESHYGEDEAVELADDAKQHIIEWAEEHEDNVVTTRELRQKVIDVLEHLDTDVALMYETHLKLS